MTRKPESVSAFQRDQWEKFFVIKKKKKVVWLMPLGQRLLQGFSFMLTPHSVHLSCSDVLQQGKYQQIMKKKSKYYLTRHIHTLFILSKQHESWGNKCWFLLGDVRVRSQVGFEPERRSSHPYLCIDFRTLHGEYELHSGCLDFPLSSCRSTHSLFLSGRIDRCLCTAFTHCFTWW